MTAAPPELDLIKARAALLDDPARAIALLTPYAASPTTSIEALRILASAYRAVRELDAATTIDHDIVDRQARQPAMVHAIGLFATDQSRNAERALRDVLRTDPDHVPALCLLAQFAQQSGVFTDAERLLRQALDVAPGFVDAQCALAQVLFARNDVDGALVLLDQVLAIQPNDRGAAAIKLRVLGQTGDYEAALTMCERLLAYDGCSERLWISYANLLKTLGRRTDSSAAFRRAIALAPQSGEGWWGLADLKIEPFTATDIRAMTALLARNDLTDAARARIDFALGKAFGDEDDYAASFEHYRRGNALRRAAANYDPDATTHEVDQAIGVFTPDLFAQHASVGSNADDPIFILGMPRAGSTLIEQILASHPLIEGTSELPDIPLLLQSVLAERWHARPTDVATAIAALPPGRFAALGEAYLSAARRHRKTDRPFFIDKLPNNWLYVGFIHLILPGARIIDARRGAMACCFANFTQYFAQGQEFSYDLIDMGRYYRDYVRLMNHFDAVLPGRVHRVDHERLIARPKDEIAGLLADLALPFDDRCLRFYENPRPVRTASAEQVRRPITSVGVERWRSYERWLEPLKQVLAAQS